MSNKRIYGIALIVVMLLKYFVTWLLGVRPDPTLTTLNLVVGCMGGILLFLGRRDEQKKNDERSSSESHPEVEQSW